MILMVIIIVVVTIYTAGAAAAYFGAAGGFSGGLAVLAGTSGLTMGAAMGAAAIGGAVGSIVGQGLAMATGYQEKFSWSQVAMSAVGSAVGAGVGSAFAPAAGAAAATPSVFQVAGQAALGNIVTQGANKILGLDKTKKFDWRGVAASAVGAVAGQALGNAMGQPATQMSGFLQNSVKGFATGVLSSMVRREDKPNYASIAGSAIANALVSELGWDPITAEDAYTGAAMRNMAASRRAQPALYGGGRTAASGSGPKLIRPEDLADLASGAASRSRIRGTCPR